MGKKVFHECVLHNELVQGIRMQGRHYSHISRTRTRTRTRTLKHIQRTRSSASALSLVIKDRTRSLRN